MTPYRYFRDKQEILAAVRAAAFDRFADAMEKAANGPGDAVTKALRFALRDEQAYRLMFDLSQPHLDALNVRAGGVLRQMVREIVER